MKEEGLASVAFSYFDFMDSSKQDFRGVLSSLLTQLSAQSDACCGVLEDMYSKHDAGSKEPSEDALRECLMSMLTLEDQGPIFIILDAIDECPTAPVLHHQGRMSWSLWSGYRNRAVQTSPFTSRADRKECV